MVLLIMNSSRASPTPALGSLWKSNARSGFPTFMVILNGSSGIVSSMIFSTSKARLPRYTNPVSPSAQLTVAVLLFARVLVASPQPTTAGIPSSRAMMAAWQVRPPRFVTIAADRFITGSQSGSVISVTRTAPGWTWSSSVIDRTTRTVPTPIFWPTLRPLARTGPVSFR